MAYFEKDNHGTLQDTVQKADAYWFNRNFGTGKPEPYLLYAFKTADEAKKALTGIDFIHVAADTGMLISLKICHYGFYHTQSGHWEAFVGGGDLTLADFNHIKTLFISNNGFVINEKAPEKNANEINNAGGTVDISKVIFKEKYQKPADATRFFTYEIFEAPDKATAIKFLEGKTVVEPLYYLLVDTPQGSFGKDNGGIYDG